MSLKLTQINLNFSIMGLSSIGKTFPCLHWQYLLLLATLCIYMDWTKTFWKCHKTQESDEINCNAWLARSSSYVVNHTLLTFELFSVARVWLWTGFWAYITTATEMRTRATTVWAVRGIPSRGTLNTSSLSLVLLLFLSCEDWRRSSTSPSVC